jgi:glutamate dehydrogenase
MRKRNANLSSKETASYFIKKISDLALKQANSSDRKLLEEFIPHYFVNPSMEILTRLPEPALAEDLLDTWQFFKTRVPNEPKIRIYHWKPQKKYALTERLVIDIVNDNMSFLLDSLYGILGRYNLKPRLTWHPLFKVVRNKQGVVTKILSPKTKTDVGNLESLIHCEIVDNISPELIAELEKTIKGALLDIRLANRDWMAMRQKSIDVVEELEGLKSKPFWTEEFAEVINFVRWIENEHFTFLGYCNYDLSTTSTDTPFHRVKTDPPLGIFENKAINRLPTIFEGIDINKHSLKYIFESSPVIINKTTKISNVHRDAQMDLIGIRRFDAKGNVIGMHMFIGLYTSVAYDSSARDIPLLRSKTLRIIEKAGFKPEWHDGKALAHLLDSLPRDELFQASIPDLTHIGLSVLSLQDNPRLAFFVRRDQFNRFLSCLVYIPRERFDSELCDRIGLILAHEFGGEVGLYKAQFGSLQFARVQYTITSKKGFKQSYNLEHIEQILIEEARSWTDELKNKLKNKYDEIESDRLYRRYASAFGRSYQDRFMTEVALHDIEELEEILKTKTLRVKVYSQQGAVSDKIKIKIYQPNQQLALSDALPILENLDLRVISEIPFKVTPSKTNMNIWIHDFELESRSHYAIDVNDSGKEIGITYLKVISGEIENDNFNRLVLCANLNWRQVMIIRAYSKYIRQMQLPFSKAYLANILAKNPAIVALMMQLFEKRFDPAFAQEDQELYLRINEHFESIDNADEDRMLRIYLNLIIATLRTNAYQTDPLGQLKNYISFKFDSSKINDLPLPKPLYEIFVYSPRVEAIHLRGGKIARGGIRWSERQEDFRAEILGLMKAQMVKNAVIVPVGSKGGFIVKTPLEGKTRDEIQQEGIHCYQTMMRGLLDLTDNLIDNQVVTPANLVCWDKEDPYLVVAADKGTATFSDIANAISQSYNYWLGDAFASGGSAGYDHKKIGITARGAWEAIKRHFREMDMDIQTQPFSVVGVGDMSGDVFGNGMLLSKQIKLIAAFNHLHIFIDPNPDPEKSFKERQRLFNLPRSGWDDYNEKLISKGGGVFARSSKTIKLTDEIQKLLNTTEPMMKPNELIHRLLMLESDLLWFGGIGTYIKSSQERNSDVSDRSNDSLRVDARDLKCKVIGEGANLAVTQLGRIEFARRCKGRINTDFIDNSGGVACSDREVNIKILFNALVHKKTVSLEQRNKMLVNMTDDVADLVIRINYEQAQTLSFLESLGYRQLDQQIKLMRSLEQEGVLNRQLEYLPDDATLDEFQALQIGLTRPEHAILLSYSKVNYFHKILKTQIPDDQFFNVYLLQYFPSLMQDKFKNDIKFHPLSREIIATIIVNEIENRMGSSFIYDAMDATESELESVFHAFYVVKSVFDLERIWTEIENLDDHVLAEHQMQVLYDVFRILRRASFWILRYYPLSDTIQRTIDGFSIGIEAFLSNIYTCLDDSGLDRFARQVAHYEQMKLPKSLAERLAMLQIASSSPDIILIASETDYSVPHVAGLYFRVGHLFGFNKIREIIDRSPVTKTQWDRHLVQGILEDIFNYQSDLVVQLLQFAKNQEIGISDGGELVLKQWSIANRNLISKIDHIFTESHIDKNPDLTIISLLVRELRALSGN